MSARSASTICSRWAARHLQLDIGKNGGLARCAFARNCDRTADCVVAQQNRLDLTEFDPETAHLDLLVARPRYCNSPSWRIRTRSPVRYSFAPGASRNQSAGKRSLVSAGMSQ